MAKTLSELIASRRKNEEEEEKSLPSSSASQSSIGGLIEKNSLSRSIGFDTFESDLNTMNSTINDIYSTWQTPETMANTRASVEAMQKRVNDYATYQNKHMPESTFDVNSLVKGYQTVLDDWDTLTQTYAGFKNGEAYKNYPNYLKPLEKSEKEKEQRKNALDNAFDKYRDLMDSEDFAAYSSYKPSAKRDGFWKTIGMDGSDETYEYINDKDGAREKLIAKYKEGNGATELEQHGYEYMTGEEIAVYNYIYNTEGKESADKYLENMETTLSKRLYDDSTETWEQWTDDSAIASAGLSLVSPILNLAGGIGSAIDTARETFTGKEYNPYSPLRTSGNMASDIRQYVGENIAESTEGMELFGQNIPQFLYQTGMSIGDSALGASTLGRAFTPIMGMTAYQQKAKELTEAGEDTNTVQSMALASGIAEALFEYASIDKLLKIDNVDGWKNAIKSTFKQMGVEGSEELFTEIANIASDVMVRGEGSEVLGQYNDLIARGYSEDEAKTEMARQVGSQLGWAFMGGALSGGVMGGVTSGNQYHALKETGSRIRENDHVDDMLGVGKDSRFADTYNLYTEYAKKYADKDGGASANITDAELGNLYHTARQGVEKNSTKNTAKELRDDAMQTAKGLAKVDTIKSESQKTREARVSSLNTGEVTEVTSTGNSAKLEGFSFKDGEMMVQTSEGEFASSDMTFSQKDAELVAFAEGMGETKGSLLMAQYDGHSDVESYVESFNLAYAYGETGFGSDSVLRHKGVLTNAQASAIYTTAMTNRATAQQNAINEINQKYSANVEHHGMVDDSAVNYESLTATQRDAVNFVKAFSNATGINVRLFESKVVDGKHVGENGSYNKATNTISIDVHAGIIDAKGLNDAIIPTLSHEMTHWMKAKSPEMYNNIREIIMNTLSVDGLTSEARVAAEIQRMRDAHPEAKVTEEDAIDEIIARGCEDMFSNSKKVREIMSGLSESEKKSFIDKVKSTFKNLIDWVNELLSKYKSNSHEAKILREYKESLQKASEMWDKALEGAIQTNKALTAEGITGEQAINNRLNEIGLEYDEASGTVFSLRSLEDAFDYDNAEDYLKAREEYVNTLANATGKTKAEADRYLNSLFLVHDMIARDKDRLDYEAAVNKSAWVSNVEYGGSIDFSTLCAKRRLFTGTFDAIQNALPNTVLTDKDYLNIRNLLLENEEEAPCSMCYVEGSRAKAGEYINKWLQEYLKTNPKWRPRIADFASATGLEKTRIQHPEAYKAYQEAMNKLSQRKPKEASVRTDYKGEILVAFADGTSVEIKNLNGGIRFNSFSDFEIIHTLDCMQVITDMARVGLAGQGYTKVKEFAKCFGNTGMKINLSLVAKGVDENGRLIFDEVNGMSYKDAMELRNEFSENVGTVIVCFDVAQIKAALADNTIDYVLPFHRSQWRKAQYALMGLPATTKDFTMSQNDRIRNPKTGKPVKLEKIKHVSHYTNDVTGESYEVKGNIMPNQYWDYTKSGRENAQRYLDYINQNKMVPKFDFVLNKADGKWILPEGAVGDGYFKLLIEFKMYDNNGVGSPQKPVLPEFNMPFIEKMLEDYKGGHESFPVAHDVVDDFVAEYKKNHPKEMYSDRMPLSEQIDKAVNNELPRRQSIYFGNTSEILQKVGLSDLPVLYTQRHLRDALAPKDEKKHQHGLTKAQILRIPYSLENPVMILDSISRSDSVVVVTDMFDGDGCPVIAVIQPDGQGMLDAQIVSSNFMASVYGREGFEGFIDRTIKANAVLYVNKLKSQNLYRQARVQFPRGLTNLGFDKIIHQSNNIVKQYSDRDSDGNTLSAEQMEYFKDSKVRDDDGNLKVMYHGSENAGFHEFSNRFSDDSRSFFFTDSAVVAKGYSGTKATYTAKTLKTASDVNKYLADLGYFEDYYVEMVDGQYVLYENGDEIARSDSAPGIYDEFRDWTGLGYGSANYKVYLNIKNPLVVDADNNNWDEIPFEGKTVTTRDLAEHAEKHGYDGVSINNVYDYGLYASTRERVSANVVIAFNSNQIKSVANTNPTEDADIRYSDRISVTEQLAAFNLEGKWNDYIGVQKEVISVLKSEGFFDENEVVNKESGMTIRINAKGIKETLGTGKRFQSLPKMLKIYKIATLRSLPRLIETGKLMEDNVANVHHADGDKFAYFLNEIVIDGEVVGVRISVKKKTGSNIFWIHNIDEYKKGTELLDPSEKMELKETQSLNANIAHGDSKVNLQYSDRYEDTWFDLFDSDDTFAESSAIIEEDVNRLKERLSMGASSLDDSQVKAIAKHLLEKAGSKYNLDELMDDIKDIYGYIETTDSLDANVLMARCNNVARSILSEQREVQATNDYAKMVLKDIRGTKLKLDAEQIAEAKKRYGEKYRQALFGRIFLSNDGISLDSKWKEWSAQYPSIFDENVNSADQITELSDIYDSLKTASEVKQRFDSASDTMALGAEIYNQYWIRSTMRTESEKHNQKVKELNFKHRNAMKKLREDYKKRVEKQKLADSMHYGRIINDIRQKNKADVKMAKELGKRHMDAYKDRVAKNAKIEQITNTALTLNAWMRKNSKDAHIHETMKPVVAYLLDAIDFSSKRLLNKGVETKKDISLQKALSDLQSVTKDMRLSEDAINALYGDDLDEEMKELVDSVNDTMRTVGDNQYVLNQMSLEELETLNKVIKSIKHSVTRLNRFHVVNHSKGIANLGQEFIRHAKKYGQIKLHKHGNNARFTLDWGNALPFYTMKRFGDAGIKVRNALMDGQDKLAFNADTIIKYAEKAYTSEECKAWSQDIKTFEILLPSKPGEQSRKVKIQMPVAHIMSLHCLSKREHALGHLSGGGIRIMDFETKNGIISQSDGVLLLESELNKIIGTLTKRQREVADALQKFMNEECSDWGNEISMARFGYKAFTEKNYFPISSDKTITGDGSVRDQEKSLYRLINMSFAKPLVEGANNRIEIDNIFDVFAQHTSEMAKYNAMALPVLDATRWFAYHEKGEKVDTHFNEESVRGAMEKAYGKDAVTYVRTLLQDINGADNVGRDRLAKGFMSRAKIASVGFNLKVVALQPTSYLRARAVIDGKYLVKAKVHKPQIAMAEKWCGLAKWKSFGFYDINIQRGLADLIKHEENAMDKATEISMKGAEWADKYTLGFLWNACEYEIKDERKDLKVGSDEFYTAVGLRLREVICSTQVVDSTMTRSHMMRSGDRFDKILTNFAAEPTLSYNMVLDCVYDWMLTKRETGSNAKAFQKYGRKFARTAYAYTVTSAITAMWEMLFSMFRDDDEEKDEEEIIKMYLENFALNMSIMNKIPYANELISAIQGFKSSSMDSQWMQYFVYAGEEMFKVMNGEGSPYKMTKHALRGASYLSGIPGYNFVRDLKSLWNLIVGNMYPSMRIEEE